MSFLFSSGLRGSAIPDSVIHRYDFEDESDTSTLTDIVGSADGSITGMAYTTTAAEDSYAGDFDGSDDEVEIQRADDYPISFTFYVYPQDVGGSGNTWISWGFNFDDGLGIAIKANSGGLEVLLGNDSPIIGGSLSQNTKYHIGVTISDSGNITAYINGEEVDSASGSSDGVTSTSYIGSEGGENHADVILDDVEVHDKELTQSEVEERM
ncbi:MAG: LamG-like jellyroll fold domain-containing protein [Salinivenus sp.]